MKNHKRSSGGSAQIVIGLMVMALGCVFLADNLGLAHFDFRFHLWPTLLIIFGVLKLSQTRTVAGYVVGGVLLLAGLSMTFRLFAFLHLDWGSLWPLLIILLGVSVVYKAFTGQGLTRSRLSRLSRRQRRFAPEDEGASGVATGAGAVSLDKTIDDRGVAPEMSGDDSIIDATAILGGYKRRIVTPNFLGGEITAIMGGCELDLRQSSIQSEALLEVFAVCGGITLKVPPDWTVVLQGTPLLGGFEEKTVLPPDGSKRLVVRGYAIMGGLEVRN